MNRHLVPISKSLEDTSYSLDEELETINLSKLQIFSADAERDYDYDVLSVKKSQRRTQATMTYSKIQRTDEFVINLIQN